jgi:hypothetical protein
MITPRHHKTISAILFMLVVAISSVHAFAQSRSGSPARDVAREIQRVDREQMLLRSPITSNRNDAVRLSLLKKVKDDFRSLQSIHNKMMEEVWANDQVDYTHTSDMISRVRDKAVALKNNLYLPVDSFAKKVESPSTINGLKDLREALLVLDKFVMDFVNNPGFQKFDVIDVSEATKAGNDLDAVISLTGDLKKHMLRLSAEAKRTR